MGWRCRAARTRPLRRARAGAPSGSSGAERFSGNRTAAQSASARSLLSSLAHHSRLIVGGSTLAVKSAASHGVVAQLGERRVRNAKVGSSILLHSTNFPEKETRRRLGAIGAQVPLRPQSVGAVQMIVS